MEGAKQEIVDEVKSLKSKYEENTAKMQDLQMHKAIAEQYAEQFNLVTVKQYIETYVNAKLYEASTNAQQFGGAKPILESKAISDLSLLDDSKNYRAWNKKFKNALEQTRANSRTCLTFIESLMEKTIQDTYSSQQHSTKYHSILYI